MDVESVNYPLRRGSPPVCSLLFLALWAGAGSAQDTLVVRADNPPVWGGAPAVVEEIRIGGAEAEEAYNFGRILGVVVQDDGVIWAADGIAMKIRRFTAEGVPVGDVGRRGEGPGEFERLSGIARLPDGRVAAWDPALGRMSLFSSAGKYLGGFRVAAPVISGPETLRSDKAGFLYVRDAIGAFGQIREAWIRVALDGQVQDTIWSPPMEIEGPQTGQNYPIGKMYAFSQRTMSELDPAGNLIVGRNDTYAFDRLRGDGCTVRVERSWEPLPVGRKERRAFQRLEDHYALRNGRTARKVPSQKPPFWRLWIDQTGRLWVARHGVASRIPETPTEQDRRDRFGNPPREWWEPLVFDVIDPTGHFLGTIQFPNHLTKPVVAKGFSVWVIEEGQFGEESILRYRIEAG